MPKNIISMTVGWRLQPMLALPTQNVTRVIGDTSTLQKPSGNKQLDKILASTDYWAEPKINGHRCVYIDGGLYSRALGVDGNQVCNSDRLPHILEELQKEDPDNKMILDGEIAFDVADSSNEDVTTILGCSPDKSQLRIRARALVYFVFDILRLPNGEDISHLPLQARRKMLDGIFIMAFTRFVIPTEVYDPLRGYNLEEVMEFAKTNNWEGLIFKNRLSPYLPGARRANTWYKWKIQDVVDEQVFITHIYEPEMYHRDSLGRRDYDRFTRLYLENLAGGVRIAQIDPITGVTVDRGRVGAWSDAQRRLFTTEPEKWINRVFDLSAFRKTQDGKFISGKFVRWRDDLRKEDCSSEPTRSTSDEEPFDYSVLKNDEWYADYTKQKNKQKNKQKEKVK